MAMNITSDSAKKLTEDVLAEIKRTITDVVFLVIQNDRDFLSRYLHLVSSSGLNQTNSRIGRYVKELEKHAINKDINENPRSILIQTHTIHE